MTTTPSYTVDALLQAIKEYEISGPRILARASELCSSSPGYTLLQELTAALSDLIGQIDAHILDIGGEANFETGQALAVLARAAELTQVTAQSVERASPQW